MKKFKDVWILWVGILIIAYLAGPKLSAPLLDESLPVVSCSLNQLENYVAQKESKFSIKPDNQSRIIWADTAQKQQTEYALLYLHGFSASWYEGADLNLDYAKKYGMNAYFPRLYGHGLNTNEALLDMKPDSLYTSALEALVIASKMGKKVIIMSTSTGGTLSVKLAAEHPELVHALILLSPNSQIKNKSAAFLTMPWGMQIARLFSHTKYRETGDKDTLTNKYWYTKYRLEGVGYLQQMVDNAMNKNKVLSKVKCPVFMGYYYKDKKNQDQVVEVKGMLRMFDRIATPEEQKVKVAFPDAGCHVIGNSHFSKSFNQVENEVFKFTSNILKINPVVK